MKYGEHFERESVPEWSLHNIDYNSLKHFIKVHTTKDEAKAITIPGQPDTHLAKVEDELYAELCAQHDRAGLFVTAKADELDRRLQHLSGRVQRLILRCTHDDPERMPPKRQRRFMRLECEVLRCGNDIQYLQRFVNAQTIAFRKILKKYRKWTGSSLLGSRFKEDVLTQPKSFTRKDFQPLQHTYDELLSTTRASTPEQSLPQSPALDDEHAISQPDSARQPLRRVTIRAGPPQTIPYTFPNEQTGYWNEYENGSEGGDMADEYVIYTNPDEMDNGIDLRSLVSSITAPFAKACSWFKPQRSERQSLLSGQSSDTNYGATDDSMTPAATGSYFSNPPGRAPQSRGNDSSTAVETDADDDADLDHDSILGYPSSEEFPAGYETRYASTFPSINDQRMALYQDRVVFLATGGLFSMSFLLLGIATVLMLTGRHKLRAEVDAGVTVGSVVSLGCACTALALTMARWDSLTMVNKAVVAVTFATACVLNWMLLVLVMGNTAL